MKPTLDRDGLLKHNVGVVVPGGIPADSTNDNESDVPTPENVKNLGLKSFFGYNDDDEISNSNKNSNNNNVGSGSGDGGTSNTDDRSSDGGAAARSAGVPSPHAGSWIARRNKKAEREKMMQQLQQGNSNAVQGVNHMPHAHTNSRSPSQSKAVSGISSSNSRRNGGRSDPNTTSNTNNSNNKNSKTAPHLKRDRQSPSTTSAPSPNTSAKKKGKKGNRRAEPPVPGSNINRDNTAPSAPSSSSVAAAAAGGRPKPRHSSGWRRPVLTTQRERSPSPDFHDALSKPLRSDRKNRPMNATLLDGVTTTASWDAAYDPTPGSKNWSNKGTIASLSSSSNNTATTRPTPNNTNCTTTASSASRPPPTKGILKNSKAPIPARVSREPSPPSSSVDNSPTSSVPSTSLSPPAPVPVPSLLSKEEPVEEEYKIVVETVEEIELEKVVNADAIELFPSKENGPSPIPTTTRVSPKPSPLTGTNQSNTKDDGGTTTSAATAAATAAGTTTTTGKPKKLKESDNPTTDEPIDDDEKEFQCRLSSNGIGSKRTPRKISDPSPTGISPLKTKLKLDCTPLKTKQPVTTTTSANNTATTSGHKNTTNSGRGIPSTYPGNDLATELFRDGSNSNSNNIRNTTAASGVGLASSSTATGKLGIESSSNSPVYNNTVTKIKTPERKGQSEDPAFNQCKQNYIGATDSVKKKERDRDVTANRRAPVSSVSDKNSNSTAPAANTTMSASATWRKPSVATTTRSTTNNNTTTPTPNLGRFLGTIDEEEFSISSPSSIGTTTAAAATTTAIGTTTATCNVTAPVSSTTGRCSSNSASSSSTTSPVENTAARNTDGATGDAEGSTFVRKNGPISGKRIRVNGTTPEKKSGRRSMDGTTGDDELSGVDDMSPPTVGGHDSSSNDKGKGKNTASHLSPTKFTPKKKKAALGGIDSNDGTDHTTEKRPTTTTKGNDNIATKLDSTPPGNQPPTEDSGTDVDSETTDIVTITTTTTRKSDFTKVGEQPPSKDRTCGDGSITLSSVPSEASSIDSNSYVADISSSVSTGTRGGSKITSSSVSKNSTHESEIAVEEQLSTADACVPSSDKCVIHNMTKATSSSVPTNTGANNGTILLGNQERGDITRKNDERRCDSKVSFPKSTNNDKIDTAVPLLGSAPPPAATVPADNTANNSNTNNNNTNSTNNQRPALSSASNTVIHDSDTAIAQEILPTEDSSSSIASGAIPAEKQLLTGESTTTTSKKMTTTGQSKHSSNGNGNGGCVDHSSNSTFENNGGPIVDGKEKKEEEDTKQAKSDDSSNDGFPSGPNEDDSVDHDETRENVERVRDDQEKNKEEKTKQAESDESSDDGFHPDTDGIAERRKANNDDEEAKPHANNNNHYATHTGPLDISNKDNITSSGRSKAREGLGDKTNTDAIVSKASAKFGRSTNASLAANNDEENDMNTDIEDGRTRSSKTTNTDDITFSSISKNTSDTSTKPSKLQDSNHVREEEDGARINTKNNNNDSGCKTKCVSDVEGNYFNKDATTTLERVLATAETALEAAPRNEEDGFDFPLEDNGIEESILAETNTNTTTMMPRQPSPVPVPPPFALLPTTATTPAVKALFVCPLPIPPPSSVPVPIRSPVLTTTLGSTSSREGAIDNDDDLEFRLEDNAVVDDDKEPDVDSSKMNFSDNAHHEADGRLDLTSKSLGRGSTHESATDIDRKRRALMGTNSKRDSSEIGFATNAEYMSSKTPAKKGTAQDDRTSDGNLSDGNSNEDNSKEKDNDDSNLVSNETEDVEDDDDTSGLATNDDDNEISTKRATFTELQSETESKAVSISSGLIAASTNTDDPDDSAVHEVSTAAFSDCTVPNSVMDAEATNTDNINTTHVLPSVGTNQRAPTTTTVDPTVHGIGTAPASCSTVPNHNPQRSVDIGTAPASGSTVPNHNPQRSVGTDPLLATPNEENNNNNDSNNNNNNDKTQKQKARKASNNRKRKIKQKRRKGNQVNHHAYFIAACQNSNGTDGNSGRRVNSALGEQVEAILKVLFETNFKIFTDIKINLNCIDNRTNYESDDSRDKDIAKDLFTLACCLGYEQGSFVHNESLKNISAFLIERGCSRTTYKITKEVLRIFGATQVFPIGNSHQLNDINNIVELITELTKGGDDSNREKDFYLYTPDGAADGAADPGESGSKDVCPYEYTEFKRKDGTNTKDESRKYRAVFAVLQQRDGGRLFIAEMVDRRTDAYFSFDGNKKVKWEAIVSRCKKDNGDFRMLLVKMKRYSNNIKLNWSGHMPIRSTRHNLGEPVEDADGEFNCVQIAYFKILRYVGIKFYGEDYPYEEAERVISRCNVAGYTAITKIEPHLNSHNYTMEVLAGFTSTSDGKIFLMKKGIFLLNIAFWRETDPSNKAPPSCNRHVALFFADEKWFADGHGTSGLSPHDLNDPNTLKYRTQDMMQTHWSNNYKYIIMHVWEITKIASTASSIGSQTSATTANVIIRNGTTMKKCSICNEYKNNKGFNKSQYKKPPAETNRVCKLCQEHKLRLEASSKYYMDKE